MPQSLTASSLLPRLPRSLWRSLLREVRERHFLAQEMLFEEDGPGDSLWLLRSGTVELYKSFFGERHRLTYLSRGALLGEANFLDDSPRTASAQASTDGRALWLPNEVARGFVREHPGLALPMVVALAGRVKMSEQALVEQLVQRNLELQMQNTRLENRIRRRVRDLEQSNDELTQLAWHDPLTGCHNRRSLEKILEMGCQESAHFAVAIFDVDNFKHYNDTHGHPAGDEALKTLVRLLGRRLRTNDVLARYGGEEFCLILRDISGQLAVKVCERLRQAITDYEFPHERHQPQGDFTVSMGLATFPEEGRTPAQLLKVADERLYTAKRSGRNRLVGGEYGGL